MSSPFPLAPVPSYYRSCSFPSRNGVFYKGGSVPTIILSGSGPTAYTVRNYEGDVVSSGAVSGVTVVPIAPVGGWALGWYRIYFTGPTTDAVFGTSYAATNFSVIRPDSRFPQLPAPSTLYDSADPSREVIGKGVLGMGTSRLSVTNANAPTTGNGTIAALLTDIQNGNDYWASPVHTAFAEPNRPREQWVNFPGRTIDEMNIPNSAGQVWLNVITKTPEVNGATTFVSLSTGTISGVKVTVSSPDASTTVETYDNLVITDAGAAQTKINAASAYISVWTRNNGTAALIAATAIGDAYKQGVKQVVQTLYPAGVHYFEGPINEPSLTVETVQRMRLFQGYVHQGNAAAQAIGPCPVSIDAAGWRTFLAAGGGAWCDGFSFHDYNSMTNGDLAIARSSIPAFLALLVEFGQQDKLLWQTEAGAAFSSVYAIYHPRRVRVKLMHALVWEQYGIPRERNSYWYDRSQGYWSFPTWWINRDTSLNPDAALWRVLAEETFNRPFDRALSFGYLGDRIFVGNIYSDETGSTAVFIAASHMDNCTVTLQVTGSASALEYVDSFGDVSTLTVTNGRVIVPVRDIPVYLRLPVGISVTVYTCNDWPPVSTQSSWVSSSVAAIDRQISSKPAPELGNGQWPTKYGDNSGYAFGTTPLPDSAVMMWQRATRFDRVILWCGQSWQVSGTLVDFDIQTSNNGTDWTTRKTVTRPTPTSFLFGNSYLNTGTQRETFWDEQWIFDIKLDEVISSQYVRVYARSGSYGGEPDAVSVDAGGQGDSIQKIVVQEMAVLCDALSNREYLGKLTE